LAVEGDEEEDIERFKEERAELKESRIDCGMMLRLETSWRI
jgi:hypothetical protein